ncbi:GNAT family N-acetyltransferase [Kitasatospora sp. NPDC101183]|uniref:GNAT family N-acetyltransferase n=1 Tax=Kitasatospora sp. NPDC101183 TaxID=3364100 RepID=UPI00382B0CAB
MDANWRGTDVAFERVGAARTGEVLEVLDEAAGWLGGQGISQWPPRFEEAWIGEAVARGETWLVRADGRVAGTVTVDWADRLWADLGGTAAYVHRLAVRRWASGLGAVVLDWAAGQAAERQAEFLRLDCVSHNPRLRAYYRSRGFEHRGDVEGSWTPTVLLSRYERRVPGALPV